LTVFVYLQQPESAQILAHFLRLFLLELFLGNANTFIRQNCRAMTERWTSLY